MTRPVSFGNNTQGSAETFFEKKVYYEKVFPEDLISNHMSLWDENRMYGRVNTDNEIIALRESSLSPLRGTKGGAAMFALGFVADAFADLRTKLKACARAGQIAPQGPFADLQVARGWSSVNAEYDKYIKNQIFSTFVEQFAIFKSQSSKIRDFSGFLEVFGTFAKHLAKMIPFTRTGFMESTYCSPYTTGLVMDIAVEDYSDDFVKSSEYVNDPNFLFFADSAKQFGFMIDRNAPWRLIANLGSAAMQRYAAKSGIELTNDRVENIAIIQDALYKRTSPVDMNILAAYLKDMYNAYVERNPYVFEQIIKEDHRCGSVSVVYEREQIDDMVLDESFVKGKFKFKWAVRSYYYIRTFERNIQNTLIQDKKNLRFLYDILTSMSRNLTGNIMDGQGDQNLTHGGAMKAYVEVVRTLESDILGPFAPLPIPPTPPEMIDETEQTPNY